MSDRIPGKALGPLVQFLLSIGGAISTQTIVLTFLVALYVISVIFFIRYLRRTRFYDCRLALTGRPKAGKTVLSILLYEHLMNGRSNDVQFTADSKSAISTYQAIRGISGGDWPPLTTTGSVLQYMGTINFRRRRVVVDLEIGDSAGEHWLNLAANEPRADPGYLQWVLSAQAIVHVVSVELFLQDEREIALTKDVEDLKLAARLMLSTKPESVPLSPLLVVVSKIDLVGFSTEDDLMKVYSADTVSRSPVMSAIKELVGIDVTSLLERFAGELKQDYGSVQFLFSSILSATSPMRLGISRTDDTLLWILDSARNSRRRRN